jgi:hypothetical protein
MIRAREVEWRQDASACSATSHRQLNARKAPPLAVCEASVPDEIRKGSSNDLLQAQSTSRPAQNGPCGSSGLCQVAFPRKWEPKPKLCMCGMRNHGHAQCPFGLALPASGPPRPDCRGEPALSKRGKRRTLTPYSLLTLQPVTKTREAMPKW